MITCCFYWWWNACCFFQYFLKNLLVKAILNQELNINSQIFWILKSGECLFQLHRSWDLNLVLHFFSSLDQNSGHIWECSKKLHLANVSGIQKPNRFWVNLWFKWYNISKKIYLYKKTNHSYKLRITGETAGPIGLKFYVDIFFQNFFSSNFCFNGKRRALQQV